MFKPSERPEVLKAQDLAQKHAWRRDSRGRVWNFEREGLHCVAAAPPGALLATIGGGGHTEHAVVLYADLNQVELQGLIGQARLPEVFPHREAYDLPPRRDLDEPGTNG